jgi:hypothetical protein
MGIVGGLLLEADDPDDPDEADGGGRGKGLGGGHLFASFVSK